MTSSTSLALMTLLMLGVLSTALAVGLDKPEGNEPGYWSQQQRPFDLDQGGLDGYDSDFLGKLVSPRGKRHWCRRGMTYSPLLGGCKLSFSAMRGRGRRH